MHCDETLNKSERVSCHFFDECCPRSLRESSCALVGVEFNHGFGINFVSRLGMCDAGCK